MPARSPIRLTPRVGALRIAEYEQAGALLPARRGHVSRSVRVEEFFALIGLVAGPLSIALSVAMYYTRKELNRLRAESSPRMRDDRMERMEQAVDAIAAEVERLAQQQQFTQRLLAERSERESASRGPNVR